MLESRFVQGQCFKCHREALYYPPVYRETLDHGYVPQPRFPPGDPKHLDPNEVLAPHEVYGEHRLPPAPAPVDGAPEQVARATRDALAEHFSKLFAKVEDPTVLKHFEDLGLPTSADDLVDGYGWRAEAYERGHDAVVQYGCRGATRSRTSASSPAGATRRASHA